MAFISRITIDELNNRMDALTIVGDYVRLQNRGGRWWGLCPFHNEKTPSFTVNPDLKSYYCFGCSKGGSILSFVMEMEKLSFPEAVEYLAKAMGIDIVYEHSGTMSSSSFSFSIDQSSQNQEDAKRKEALYELYRRMTTTFHHFFLKNDEAEPVKNYIRSRGISDEMIEHFHLGYAPLDKKWMHAFLVEKGYSKEFLARSGLFSSRHPGLPLFNGRLIFPISDRQGRVVAFGGRFLEGLESFPADNPSDYKAPKYINSPELETYKKGETLFAINLALPEIRRTKTVYLAEGYVDVIALHQAGVTNAVAPLGTAFTDEQAKLLRRWAEKAVFVFDSDEAGQQATVKGILCCRKNGLASAVVVPQEISIQKEISNPKDPADILQHFGPEALQKRMKCFINDCDYLISRAKSLFDIRDSGGKSQAASFLFPYLGTLESEVSRDACIEAAAAAIGTSKSAVQTDWQHFNANASSRETRSLKEEKHSHSSGQEKAPIRMNDELFLLMTVAVNDMQSGAEPLYPEFRKTLAIREIDDPLAKELFIALEECFTHDECNLDYFLSRISSAELKKFYLEKGVSKEFTANPQQILVDGQKKALRKRMERRRDEIVLKLKTLKMNDTMGYEADELLADKIRIDEELRKL